MVDIVPNDVPTKGSFVQVAEQDVMPGPRRYIEARNPDNSRFILTRGDGTKVDLRLPVGLSGELITPLRQNGQKFLFRVDPMKLPSGIEIYKLTTIRPINKLDKNDPRWLKRIREKFPEKREETTQT